MKNARKNAREWRAAAESCRERAVFCNDQARRANAQNDQAEFRYLEVLRETFSARAEAADGFADILGEIARTKR